jgi:hypothetical protein
MEHVQKWYVDREPQCLFVAEVGWYREFTRPYTMGTSFLCLKNVIIPMRIPVGMRKIRREKEDESTS